MRNAAMKWAVKASAAGAIAILLASPAFAQSRGERNGGYDGRDTQTRNDRDARSNRDDRSNGGSYRDNQRVTMSGRVSSFSRERDGYRVQLDRGNQSFWVPQSRFGNHSRDLRVGVSISLGGIFRNGMIYVDAVNWPGGYGASGYGYDSGYLRGVVDRVDYRDGTVWLRDEQSGRVIAADMRRADRYGRLDLRDLRRGDYVELTGDWSRRGVFVVSRIDAVRDRRY